MVFPHYRREEQTWQNSVRHVLSTTAVFRKCPRERGEGKTQWAIWDKDLRCFAGGGFDKRFCDDVPVKKAAVQKRPAPAPDPAEPASGGGRSKKRRKADSVSLPTKALAPTSAQRIPVLVPAATTTSSIPPLSAAPLFPSTNAHAHPFHRPYYKPADSDRQTTDVLFPPLPASSSFHRSLFPGATSSSDSAATSVTMSIGASATTTATSPVDSGAASPPSSSQLPELAPSSSSPSSSSPPFHSDGPQEESGAVVAGNDTPERRPRSPSAELDLSQFMHLTPLAPAELQPGILLKPYSSTKVRTATLFL
jgi:hypothetical protein